MTSLLKQLSRIMQGVRILGASLVLQSALYPFRKAYYGAKFRNGGSGGKAPRAPTLKGWLGILEAQRRPPNTQLTPPPSTFTAAHQSPI